MIFIFIAFALAACSVSYKASDMQKSINKSLPKKVDMKVATLNVKSMKTLKLYEKDQRMSFSFDCVLENKLKDLECSAFRISAKPMLKGDKIILTDIRADDVNCGIPVTGLINAVKDYFFKEVDVVELSGMKKALVQGVYIKGDEVVVKVGLF